MICYPFFASSTLLTTWINRWFYCVFCSFIGSAFEERRNCRSMGVFNVFFSFLIFIHITAYMIWPCTIAHVHNSLNFFFLLFLMSILCMVAVQCVEKTFRIKFIVRNCATLIFTVRKYWKKAIENFCVVRETIASRQSKNVMQHFDFCVFCLFFHTLFVGLAFLWCCHEIYTFLRTKYYFCWFFFLHLFNINENWMWVIRLIVDDLIISIKCDAFKSDLQGAAVFFSHIQ